MNRGLKKHIFVPSCALIIGDRGSGKSSLMSMIATLMCDCDIPVYSQYPFDGARSIPMTHSYKKMVLKLTMLIKIGFILLIFLIVVFFLMKLLLFILLVLGIIGLKQIVIFSILFDIIKCTFFLLLNILMK